jgi:hypothetical protein
VTPQTESNRCTCAAPAPERPSARDHHTEELLGLVQRNVLELGEDVGNTWRIGRLRIVHLQRLLDSSKEATDRNFASATFGASDCANWKCAKWSRFRDKRPLEVAGLVGNRVDFFLAVERDDRWLIACVIVANYPRKWRSSQIARGSSFGPQLAAGSSAAR